ncbi:MAG: ATP-binding protein [Hominenteromicrobium sp.]
MKKKIIRSMSVIALISIVFSMVLSGVVSYYDTLEIVKKTTAVQSEYIKNGLLASGEEYLSRIRSVGYDAGTQSVRVTLIGADGTVAFDSVADVAEMENHNDRPEVQAARANGAGESIRLSDTVNVQSYNYAVLLEDGRVLRLSVGMKTVFGSIERMMPWMILCAIAVLFVAVLLSTYRTKQIVAPINSIDLDHPMENDAYDELAPLFLRLEHQNETIREKMEELNRKQNEFTAITENMQEGFIVVDSKGDVLSYNTSAVRLLGVHEGVGHHHASVLTFNRSLDFRSAVDSALAGTASERVTRIGARSYNLIANPVMGENGVRGAVIVLLDITEKEESERMRREFTANVSHELKTPLTSISGYAEIIRNGLVKSEDIPRFAGNIYTETQRLITLVEDIIKLSRLDERAVELERAETDLLSVARDVAERLKVQADRNRITIGVTGTPAKVMGVPNILDEMIFNLADNAVKYNKPGGTVQMTAGVQDGHAFIEVADSGIGIPEGDREHVFERFYRVDKSRSKQIGGTGLGLSIVKHGAAFHNAHVTLQSEVGRGTTVRITF